MLALALALIQDSPSQADANAVAGMGILAVLFCVVFGLALFAFIIFVYWRIFTKAGLNGALSLLMLIPGIGPIIMVCILAFGDWKVVPISQVPHLQPTYAPPAYPPVSFPPSQPPAA